MSGASPVTLLAAVPSECVRNRNPSAGSTGGGISVSPSDWCRLISIVRHRAAIGVSLSGCQRALERVLDVAPDVIQREEQEADEHRRERRQPVLLPNQLERQQADVGPDEQPRV